MEIININIEDFEKIFSTNNHRAELFEEFSTFVENVREFFSMFSIAVYGSYITKKENPNDIDIILCGHIKNEKIDSYNSSDFKRGDKLYVQLFSKASMFDHALDDIQDVIIKFSSTEANRKSGFSIEKIILIS